MDLSSQCRFSSEESSLDWEAEVLDVKVIMLPQVEMGNNIDLWLWINDFIPSHFFLFLLIKKKY